MKSVWQEASDVRRKRDRILIIFCEGAATCGATIRGDVGGIVRRQGHDVETCLGICGIDVVRSEQPVSLRSDIANLSHQVPGQLPLEIKVVLRGILGAQLGLEIPVKQHGTERGPVLRGSSRGAEDSIKRVRTDGAGLRDEGGIHESRRQKGAAAKWRLGAELLEH